MMKTALRVARRIMQSWFEGAEWRPGGNVTEAAEPRRPSVIDALSAMVRDSDIDYDNVKRLEIVLRANGEAVWRAYPDDGGDTFGGTVRG
jgi:hypothetical protein